MSTNIAPQSEILTRLDEQEEQHDITIIAARVRGSHRQGVAHDDSDTDILFLYVQPGEYYAGLHGRIDAIHDPQDPIDLHGWNIDKFAALLADSNPDALEFCASPTDVIPPGVPMVDAETEALQNFNRISLHHHYRSMAKRNYRKYVESGNEPTINRQYHSLRPAAAARHIRITNGFPPLNVWDLLTSPAIEGDLYGLLEYLAEAKQDGYVDREIEDIVGEEYEKEANVGELAVTDERITKPDTEIIDAFIKRAF